MLKFMENPQNNAKMNKYDHQPKKQENSAKTNHFQQSLEQTLNKIS